MKRIAQILASGLFGVAGLFVAATAASAHQNIVSGTVTCVTTSSTAQYDITWTISNDWNLTETAFVTSMGDYQPPSVFIAASSSTANESTGTVTQIVEASTTGTETIVVHG